MSFFFFKQKTAYEIMPSLVGSEMCIRDSIELLVVIAVIGILAALIFPITGALKKKKMITVAQAELAQVETAIDAYKAKYGTYPPDNPANPLINPLYFELEGTTNNGSGYYQTLDGSGQIASLAQFNTLY